MRAAACCSCTSICTSRDCMCARAKPQQQRHRACPACNKPILQSSKQAESPACDLTLLAACLAWQVRTRLVRSSAVACQCDACASATWQAAQAAGRQHVSYQHCTAVTAQLAAAASSPPWPPGRHAGPLHAAPQPCLPPGSPGRRCRGMLAQRNATPQHHGASGLAQAAITRQQGHMHASCLGLAKQGCSHYM